ncbi:MAG TPA: zinc ribbon domain-containing protein [Bacteroidales bacterium]|nr:zinc ribbon domain-containing protein [Bacteroidales bacterium]HPS17012.1 zinc ribbon domain-containing protein [Bacteroidales bacterium]
MNQCPQCNSLLKPNAKFCHNCGCAIFNSNSTPIQTLTTRTPLEYQKPYNRQKYYAWTWFAMTIIFLFCFLYPFISDMDMFEGGGAMIMIGLVMFITSVIVTPFYFKRASRLSRILSGQNVLVYWVYSPEEWREYTSEELKQRKSEKWALFWVITVIAFVVNTIMSIIHPDGIIIFLFVQVGLMLLIALTAFLSYKLPDNQNRKHLGQVIIAKDGIYLNGSYHSWVGMSARFERVMISDDNKILHFVYSAMSRYSRDEYTVNVPVPNNELPAALKIIGYFKNISR